MTRFRYWFAGTAGRGPEFGGVPIVYSPFLSTSGRTTLIVEHRGNLVLTNDPDFAWNLYRAECRDQARRIVRDGLRRRLPWLTFEEAQR